MKRRFFFTSVFFLFVFSMSCFAQQVISSAGTTATSTSAQLSWTVGEPVIETFTGTGVILTQGFHQSRYTITAINLLEDPDLFLSVYPNPVADFLVLEVKASEIKSMSYFLFGMDGRKLDEGKVEKHSESINMAGYSSGTYLLKVFGKNMNQLQTFKIIKD
jgi:hypothetical protein